jgi:hypothetical protein
MILSAFLEEARPEELEIADLALEKPCDLQKLSRRIVGALISRATATE